jgi:hypothetical protein
MPSLEATARQPVNEFLKHGDIYPPDVHCNAGRGSEATPGTLIGMDEFSAGYSPADCDSAKPASASAAQKKNS